MAILEAAVCDAVEPYCIALFYFVNPIYFNEVRL